MGNEEYARVLKEKLDELSAEISSLRNEVAGIFTTIKDKQEQANHILELLSAEGYRATEEETMNAGKIHIPDIVEAYLQRNPSKEPMHYREIADQIQSQGHFIPGKDPAANLLSQISRDDRFVRVKAGTYALREWGIKPAPSRRSRRKRK